MYIAALYIQVAATHGTYRHHGFSVQKSSIKSSHNSIHNNKNILYAHMHTLRGFQKLILDGGYLNNVSVRSNFSELLTQRYHVSVNTRNVALVVVP